MDKRSSDELMDRIQREHFAGRSVGSRSQPGHFAIAAAPRWRVDGSQGSHTALSRNTPLEGKGGL